MAHHSENPLPASPDALLEMAVSARRAGDLGRSGEALDALLLAMPSHPIPLRLRAQIALERGEADALTRFDRALAADAGNPHLHLGKAQALEVAGDAKGARIVAQQIAAQAPGFIPALTFLSGLMLAAGEADFTAPFTHAARKAPQDPNIAAAHCDAFAGIERFADAARIAAEAGSRFPEEEHFAFLEASYSGSAGEWSRADALYAQLGVQSLQRWLAEARHRLRARDVDAAQKLISCALGTAPHDIAAWALQDITWRLADTSEARARAQWLHGQTGLVTLARLEADDTMLARARSRLDELHESAAMPLSQSLRGGSQTRGILFHRPDPVLAELREAIAATLETYRAGLPQSDGAHPLLSARDAPWQLAGSWSVRLEAGGDHHAAHIHPAGIISSALYITLPDGPGAAEDTGAEKSTDTVNKQGWLDLGRPPKDLGLDLPPVQSIAPRTGHLALFPSSLYHSTRPFPAPASAVGTTGAHRMSVAFDVITKPHHS